MPERKTLGKISVITDTETAVFKVGEIEGGFNTELREHIKRHGSTELLAQLARMSAQISNIQYELNEEDTGTPCVSVQRKR